MLLGWGWEMEYGLISQIANDSETFKWKDPM